LNDWSLNNFYKYIPGIIAFIPGKDERAERIAKKALFRANCKDVPDPYKLATPIQLHLLPVKRFEVVFSPVIK